MTGAFPVVRPLGAHVPTAGGLTKSALAYARDIGAEAVQVFVSNPRGWRTTPGDPADDRTFRDGCESTGLPVFVHAPYLINLGSPTPDTVTKSLEALAHALRRGAEIGACGVVVHAGSAVAKGSPAAALGQLREHLLPLLDALGAAPGAPRLLIEPTAGGGQALASRVDHLPAYLAALDEHPAVGLCLDTCHLHAAGHDLSVPGAVGELLDTVAGLAGGGRLGLIHGNDSRDPAGSTRDRHAVMGEGTIGPAAFAALLGHPATAGVPLVLETMGGRPEHTAQLLALRALRDAAPDR